MNNYKEKSEDYFISPAEFYPVLKKETYPVLLACLNRKSDFTNHKDILKEISELYSKKLRIYILDEEYLNLMTKFDIHGTPAFVFLYKGEKKGSFLGQIEPEDIKSFITDNLSDCYHK